MTVYLYKRFAKRTNSTKLPADAQVTGDEYTGKLREGTSILRPTIGFNFGHNSSPAEYNYAAIGHFDSRRYYITDWTWEEGLWWATMAVDALGTWRQSIFSSTQYVVRTSDATLWNGDIIDTMYPAKAVHTQDFGGFTSNPWPVNTDPSAGGYYTVGIANQDGAAIGGTSYYVMSNSEFRTLVQKLLASTDWTGYTDGDSDITESVYKSLFNPLQYISSCTWSPVSPNMGAAVSNLTFGWWSVSGTSAHRLGATTTVSEFSVLVPKHPQASDRGSYLNSAPYTRLTLVNGPFGVMVLNPALYTNRTNALVRYIYDHITGRATCWVGPAPVGAQDIFEIDQSQSIQFGVPIKLSQISQDFIGVASGLLDGISGGITGAITGAITGGAAGAVGGLIVGGGSGILSAIDASMPQVQSVGATGSFSGFATESRLQGQFWLLVDEDRSDIGRPLCTSTRLSALSSGVFVQCKHSHIANSATEEEKASIVAALEAGLFLEGM